MIQPNEIRLNNWVLANGRPFRIDEIEYLRKSDYKVGMFQKGFEHAHPYTWYMKDIHPIPLTEDVLLKCKGVAKEHEDDKYVRVYLISNTKYIVRIVNFGNPLKEDFGFSLEISDSKDWCSIKRIYTLHDFQNTIYSLTNQELEIEL